MKPSLLSPDHLAALRHVCDAFAPALDAADDPSGFWKRSAGDVGVAEAIAGLVSGMPRKEQLDLLRLLDLLNSPLLGLTWRGPMKPIAALSLDERTRMLNRWSCHFIPKIRKAFMSLKKLTGMLFYTMAEPDRTNPNWSAIGYPGPPAPPAHGYERPLSPLRPDRDITLTCDTLVVGSGAGGSVVASELAAHGQDVIIVEKGPYVDRDAYDGLEGRAMERMYERKGALTTIDGSVSVLAGSCVGGGTTVNWAGAFRPPDYVLQQWADDHALPEVLGPELKRSFASVERCLQVGVDRGAHNPPNRALIAGCRKLGFSVEDIPRNMRAPKGEEEWKAVGFSPFGDRFGLKQGAIDTFLREAANSGARLMADTHVDRLLFTSGHVIGVEATFMGEGRRLRVVIHARRVVVAAGAIHTPALLLRSGVSHAHIGRHLFLHPTVAVAARYPDVMNPWHGPMMSAVSNAFTRLDGPYGVKLETPPVHPGILGLALPWSSGRQHKEAMLQARHVGAIIVLTRDRDGGRVRIDSDGQPSLGYRLSPFDRDHMLRGIVEASRIHFAAGAEEVHLPHNQAPVLKEGDLGDGLLETLAQLGWGACRFPLFSAHQMGTCRMGGDEERHPVSPDGKVRRVEGLYVADASIFPESSGANPMLSVQALAHFIAQGIKAESVRVPKAPSVTTSN